MHHFDVILIDLPLPYNGRITHSEGDRSKFGGGAMKHYSVMTPEEILSIAPQVQALGSANCALFLWITSPHVRLCLNFMDACKFRHTTKAFAWEKTNADGSPAFSPGSYTASNTEDVYLGLVEDEMEDCWLAVRGTYSPASAGGKRMLNQVIRAPRAEHSAKPVEVYERIEAMYPNARKIELFARNLRPGWTSLGNEIDGKDIRDALYDITEVRETFAPDGRSWREYTSKPYKLGQMNYDTALSIIELQTAWTNLLALGLDDEQLRHSFGLRYACISE